MSPENQAKLDEMYADFQARQLQQIRFPLDEASKNSLGAVIGDGPGGSALTDNINIGATPTSIDVPAPYTGSIVIIVEGVKYEIGYLQTL